MWGNLKGWIFSGFILALMVILLYLGSRPPQISPPTGTLPLGMKSALLNVAPSSLDIKPGEKDGDAGEIYRQIIDDYAKNQFFYKRMDDDTSKLAASPPQNVQWVVDAADCPKCKLFSRKPAEIVNYDGNQESLTALKTAGTLANKIGLYDVAKKKYAEADPFLRGAFLLGQRMYEERLRFDEYTTGTALMSDAAYAMAKEARDQKNDARADQLAALSANISEYQTSVLPLWQAIVGIETPGKPLPNPGDIFEFAQKSPEPMWQTESVLKLGRMVYMDSVTPGDQRGARRVLKQMADRADLAPAVHTAAVAARDLTLEKFRMFGGGG